MTDARIDREESANFGRAVDLYHGVFGEIPESEIRFLSGGDPAVVLAGWLWMFRSTPDGRWTVRSVIPDDPWWQKYPCLSRTQGYEVERHSFLDAARVMLEWETHRRFHAAAEIVQEPRQRNCGRSRISLS